MAKLHKNNIQVSMYDRTIDSINNLRSGLNTDNRSEIIKISVDITDMLVETIKKNGRVILEDKDGNQSIIKVPGIQIEHAE